MNNRVIDSLFKGEDWHGFADAILHATGKEATREDAIKLFKKLPVCLKNMAMDWGISDTQFRELSIKHLEKAA